MARPTKYDTHVKPKLELVIGWARDGLTDEQVANNLGISTTAYYEYKLKYVEFTDALKKGKEVSDYEVEGSLFKRANGYTYDETTRENKFIDGEWQMVTTKIVTKQVAADPTSMIFWLKNRKSEQWRDRHEFDMSNNIVPVKVVNDAGESN
jgi:hypothetical protein